MITNQINHQQGVQATERVHLGSNTMGNSGEYGNKRHLGTWKTKIQNIIDLGKIDVFSVKTIIHNNNKKMGHLIWPLGV